MLALRCAMHEEMDQRRVKEEGGAPLSTEMLLSS